MIDKDLAQVLQDTLKVLGETQQQMSLNAIQAAQREYAFMSALVNLVQALGKSGALNVSEYRRLLDESAASYTREDFEVAAGWTKLLSDSIAQENAGGNHG